MTLSQNMTRRLARSIERSQQHDTSDFDLNADADNAGKGALTPAAVLIGIQNIDGRPSVLLTKRTSVLKHHPGQIAFPGGKRDMTDTDLHATALREAQEEIGLAPGQARILGALGAHTTVTGFKVSPILAEIDPGFAPEPHPGEVADAFRVPFDFLVDARNTRIEGRVWHGTRRRFYVMPYGPYYIWGATARMLVALQTAWAQS